jgi:hypothetical protein
MTPRVPQIAARMLVALTTATAGVIAVLAFMPGTEVMTYYGIEIRQAGGMLVAVLAIATIIPGLFTWIAPRPRVLWQWTAIALISSLVLYVLLEHVHSSRTAVLWWPARIVEIAVWALMLSTVLGSYVLGFALHATEESRDIAPPELAVRLRRLALGVTVLAGALLAVGFLPGQRVYHDANHCLGAMLAALGGTEHHHVPCTSLFIEPHATYPAGGGLRLALYLLVVLAPAWPAYRDPQARHAWRWFAASIAGSVVAGNLMCWLEIDVDVLSRTVTLWPVRVVELGVAAIQVVLLLGLPLMIARTRPARVPTARVVQRE